LLQTPIVLTARLTLADALFRTAGVGASNVLSSH
jgi:hypothetical protein